MSQMSQAPEMSERLNPRGDSETRNARNESRGQYWNQWQEVSLRIEKWEMRIEWSRQDPEDMFP